MGQGWVTPRAGVTAAETPNAVPVSGMERWWGLRPWLASLQWCKGHYIIDS
jgi:hypothetical protein